MEQIDTALCRVYVSQTIVRINSTNWCDIEWL
jgi:hypothetical protein